MYLGQLITTAVQAYIAAGRLEVYLSRASTEPTVAYTSQKTSQKAQDTTQKAVNDRNVKQDSVLFGDRSDANLIATPAARVVPTQGLNPSGEILVAQRIDMYCIIGFSGVQIN
ncbi:hypothetical protein SARC_16248 [Sphaeroforma arctica JP610]|uniref:Uncharacterized protein n=1 Tax=Sphaeroforma arctica JP610 TaxID=667725 RepID=A0A0L0F3A5_9EUKA|nr:hypothetical protein SARC_16248 [Sphaeroforma arctica JP610]KNC71215.1 hypothetical protein SARC_16248 [Sphaeroforma arctica JP610]|eukprot:XP_014145117.1 hypothetical protein SARC_16248 [Sphaeroforma arctica JP610]